jgi:hypothetical protein
MNADLSSVTHQEFQPYDPYNTYSDCLDLMIVDEFTLKVALQTSSSNIALC